MRKVDAPPAGWYPDPTHGSLLWWWDGLDWTDDRRNPPTPGMSSGAAELLARAHQTSEEAPADATRAGYPTATGLKSQVRKASKASGAAGGSGISRADQSAIVSEVRAAARSEVERGVQLLSKQARDATNRIEPLIEQYGDRVMKWVRNVGIAAFVVVVLYFLVQSIGAVSFLDWLGERIDSLSEPSTFGRVVALAPTG